MRRTTCVLVLLLAIPGLSQSVSAQVPDQDRSTEQRESGFSLGQNYPNPFNPETRIPFELYEDLFVDGRSAVVSIRIYNVLQQFVAAPTALRHPTAEGLPVIDMEYTEPGPYEVYWDGTDQSGQEVASGIYFVQLTVNGRRAVIRMYVTK